MAEPSQATSPPLLFHYYSGFNLQAVRSGPWKLHLGKNELYHLDEDIGEAKNVAAEHADIVAQLQKHAEMMKADLGDKTKNAPGVRKLGRVTIIPDGFRSQDGFVPAFQSRRMGRGDCDMFNGDVHSSKLTATRGNANNFPVHALRRLCIMAAENS